MVIVGCLLWLFCDVGVWLVIWWYGYVDMRDRLMEMKRDAVSLTSAAALYGWVLLASCQPQDSRLKNPLPLDCDSAT